MRWVLVLVAACSAPPPHPPSNHVPIPPLRVLIGPEDREPCAPDGELVHLEPREVLAALVRHRLAEPDAHVREVRTRDPKRFLTAREVPRDDRGGTTVGYDLRANRGSLLIRTPRGGEIFCARLKDRTLELRDLAGW